MFFIHFYTDYLLVCPSFRFLRLVNADPAMIVIIAVKNHNKDANGRKISNILGQHFEIVRAKNKILVCQYVWFLITFKMYFNTYLPSNIWFLVAT